MAKQTEEPAFDTVKLGKPYRNELGELVGYTEQEISKDVWKEQSALPEDERNPHFRGFKPLSEVKGQVLTTEKIASLQKPMETNPAVGRSLDTSRLEAIEKRFAAMEEENQRLREQLATQTKPDAGKPGDNPQA